MSQAKRKILVVDDQPLVASTLAIILKKLGSVRSLHAAAKRQLVKSANTIRPFNVASEGTTVRQGQFDPR